MWTTFPDVELYVWMKLSIKSTRTFLRWKSEGKYVFSDTKSYSVALLQIF